MKCRQCHSHKKQSVANPARWWCPTCSYDTTKRHRLANQPAREWPFGIGRRVADKLGVKLRTVNQIMQGHGHTSARISAALLAERETMTQERQLILERRTA